MTGGQLGTLLRHLRRWTGPERAEAGDAHLLQSYALRRDERSFAELLQRHGGLVWNVCRRVTTQPEDAEDAFQVTFLVLARKARRIARPELLAAWLHGVALRSARHVEASAARRRSRERQVETMPDPSISEAPLDEHAELRAVLDEELALLPERYRLPVVLCYLQGQSYTEAAAHLGWPSGTVSGRLARARELLRARLTRRGVGLSAAVLGAWLAQEATAVPPVLAAATLQTVLRDAAGASAAMTNLSLLAQGVIKTMFIENLRRSVGWLVLAGVLGLGCIALVFQPGQAQENRPAAAEAKSVDGPAAAAKPELGEEDRKYVSEIIDPEDTLEVGSGLMKVLVFTDAPKQIALSGTVANRRGSNFGMMMGAGGGAFGPGGMGPGGGRGGPGGVAGGNRNPQRGGGGLPGGGGGPGGVPVPERLVSAGSNGLLSYQQVSDHALALSGQGFGTSVMHIWFSDKKDPKKEKVLCLIVRTVDPKAPAAKLAPEGVTYKEFVQQVIKPLKTLEMIAGRPRVLMLNQTPKRVLVSNESVLSQTLLGDEDGKQLYLEANGPGSAVLCLLFADADNANRDKVLCYLIQAAANPELPPAGGGGAGGVGQPAAGGGIR